MAARQGACTNREEACERRHRDHKTHCYVLYLLLDEEHWIGRPQQVGVAIIDNEEHRRVHGQAYGMDVDINDKKPAKSLQSPKFLNNKKLLVLLKELDVEVKYYIKYIIKLVAL